MKLYPYTKRILDFTLALTALVVLSPVFIIISVIIKIDSKGPILFKQCRIGVNNQTFEILKFRTMRIDTPNVATHLLQNPEVFITRTGNFLRKTSLDELPQLINIVKGEMSIVGPRPALYNQYDLIEMRTKENIHTLRPGLTGLAQVNGRDELENEKKVDFDKDYFKKKSTLLDIKIIILTIVKVFKREGVIEGAVPNNKEKL